MNWLDGGALIWHW